MSESDDILALVSKYQKKHGQEIGGINVSRPTLPRIPSGIFEFDLASGGGIPQNAMTMIWGAESSGKTNLALLLIAQSQRLWPEKKCVFLDLEGTLEESWAISLGVDWSKLVYLQPTHIEQIIDMTEDFLLAPDCGVIALDSIAASQAMAEVEKSGEENAMGRNPFAVNKLVKKATLALNEARKAGNTPTLVWINQVRMKLGVMFGPPDTLPGGQGQRFMAAMRIKLYGKNIMDNKVSSSMPVRKFSKGVIEKWKCPIVCNSFQYEMATISHDGLEIGQTNSWATMEPYFVEYGWFLKEGTKWYMFGEEYKTKKAALESVLNNPEVLHDAQQKLIARVMNGGDDAKA